METVEKKRPGPKPKAKELTAEEQIEASRARRQRRRADIGAPDYKLQAPKREGFQRRWVNDVPGRVNQFRERGWDVVQKDGGTDQRFVGKIGRAQEDGSQYGNAVLMEIPMEFYEEDQRAKLERVVDPRTMKENQLKAGTADSPEEYVPGGKDTALRTDKLR